MSSCFCIRSSRPRAFSAPPAESNFHAVKVAMPAPQLRRATSATARTPSPSPGGGPRAATSAVSGAGPWPPSPGAGEGAPPGVPDPDGVDGDRWGQGLADDAAIAAGVDLAVAVGARAAGLAGAAVVRPVTATALGALR